MPRPRGMDGTYYVRVRLIWQTHIFSEGAENHTRGRVCSPVEISRGYFEQMKGRSTRTLDHDGLRKASPAAKTAKTHYVIVDAEILRLLDEQFTVIEQNERKIDAALKRSAALRQSILKKAFTGQLVPQDPSDEPASTLLERIRKEREGDVASTPEKRATRKANPRP